MRVQVPRYLIAVAACGLLGPAASAAVAGQQSTGSINPALAAAACHTPRAHAGKPSNLTAAKLSVLLGCVVRAERRQLGLGYAQSNSLSQLIDGALKQFIALPYLAQHQTQLADQAEQNAGQSIVKSFCTHPGPGVSRGGWEFANRGVPPALTVLELARIVSGALQSPDGVARATDAHFGVAVRQGLLFMHGDRKGVSLGVIAVTCS
jgi:hypothetical protein